MTACMAVRNEAIWLKEPDYDVVAMNSKLASHVQTLAKELRSGIGAYQDLTRENFYSIQLERNWCYVHVHGAARTVYLVAVSDTQA